MHNGCIMHVAASHIKKKCKLILPIKILGLVNKIRTKFPSKVDCDLETIHLSYNTSNTVAERSPHGKSPLHFRWEINPQGNIPPRKQTPTLLLKNCAFSAFGHAFRAMAMPQRPVGLDIKLSQPNKLSEPKSNFKMGFFFAGILFPWGLFSVGVYFLSKVKWGFFPWGFIS